MFFFDTVIHRSIVSLFIMKGIMSSAPERTSSNTAVGMLYHFGRNSLACDFFGAFSLMDF